MVGLAFLKLKRHWRGWLKMAMLELKTSHLLRKAVSAKNKSSAIVSFTSIASRVKSVDFTLRSIVNGSLLPEGIYLYVSEATANAILERNSFAAKLVEKNYLHIRKVKDVRSYTKLVYALAEHSQKDIVICDDDVMYPDYWLEELIKSRSKWKNDKIISCHRAHKITITDGAPGPYATWSRNVDSAETPAIDIFPTGTGGVLYPPGSLPAIAADDSLFLTIAPTADDIWFWLCAIQNNCKFVTTSTRFVNNHFIEVPDSQSVNLFSVNVHSNANDTQMSKCINFFYKGKMVGFR